MQTIGERLEEARKRKGISIREAAESTKIRGDYLQRFENNQFDIGLSDLYVRGFLRTYCNLLKIPSERILADYKAATTHPEVKPKGVSREVYGRMDLSIASSGGKAKDSGDSISGLDDDGEGGGTKRTFARIGTSLPTGTFVDQRVVIKIGAVIAGVIVLLLGIWAVKSLAGGSSSSSDAPRIASASEQTITLIALDNVQVKVALIIEDEVLSADGKTIIKQAVTEEVWQGSLTRGERRSVPKAGPLFITAKNGRDLELEMSNGKRYPMPFKDYNRCKVR